MNTTTMSVNRFPCRNPTPEPGDNVTEWTDFRLATSDFLLIDSTSASMQHHLRADKVEFWARLVPAIWGHLQQQKRQEALLGDDDARCPVTRSATWVLGGVVVVLGMLLVVSALLAARYHCQYRRLSVSARQDSVAKV